MSFSIRQLRYFVAVAEAGQISSGARELYVSQSAVTMAVQDMERLLGQRLFTRGSRGVQLTPTGTEFLPKARQILRLLEEAALVTAANADPQGLLRVGVTYTVMAYFLPQQIQRLAIAYPNIDVTWLEMGRPAVEDKLASGDLDFGLVLTSNLQSPELEHQTFVQSKRRLWMAPGHPLSELDEIDLADVARHPYVQLTVDEADVSTRLYWGDMQPRTFLETSSIEAVRSIVANGNGVAVLSDMVYRPWSLEGKRVDTAILRNPIPDMRIGLAWRRGQKFTSTMTALHDYFQRHFSESVTAPSP